MINRLLALLIVLSCAWVGHATHAQIGAYFPEGWKPASPQPGGSTAIIAMFGTPEDVDWMRSYIHGQPTVEGRINQRPDHRTYTLPEVSSMMHDAGWQLITAYPVMNTSERFRGLHYFDFTAK